MSGISHNMALIALIFAISLSQSSMAQDDFRRSLTEEVGDVRVNNARVADVLDDFYRNLTFVGACTDSKQDRDYGRMLDEMREILKQEELQERIEEIVAMLEKDQFQKAIDRCDLDESVWRSRLRVDVAPQQGDVEGCSSRPCPGVAGGSQHAQGLGSAELSKRLINIFRTYLSFLRAEASRLMGNVVPAASQITEATHRRQHSTGVSINDLERLNALIVLTRVSEFNQEIDKYFEINKGPNFEQLRRYRSTLQRPLTDPIPNKIVAASSAELSRLESARKERLAGYKRRVSETRLAQEIGLKMLDDDEIENRMPRGFIYQRVHPEQDDFSGQTVAKSSARGILSEFANKLVILGAAPQTDYVTVLDEIKGIDKDLVESLQRQIEDYSHLTTESLQAGGKLWREHAKTMQTYEKYFNAELYSRSGYSCNTLRQVSLLVNQIKKIREYHRGLSADKIFAMEGKLLLSSISCILQRIAIIYELNGSESQGDMEIKRAAANCEKKLPMIRFDTVI